MFSKIRRICRYINRLLEFSLLLATTFGISLRASPSDSESKLSHTPTEVRIGAYLVDINGIDLKTSTFNADLYLWMKWRGDLDPSKFEALNGKIQLVGDPDAIDNDGSHYRCWRIQGEFRARLDFHDYPADSHVLEVQFEDSTHDRRKLVYVPDLENLAQSPRFYLGTWEQVAPISAETMTFKYTTSYGNPTRSKGEVAEYSRFILSVPVRHAGGSSMIYAKTFLGLFISVAIGMLAFLIDPLDCDPRFGVGVAAIFGAVSSMLVVSGNMPENPYFSLSDKIHIFSLLVIFVTLLLSCISLNVKKKGNVRLSRNMDFIGGLACVIVYSGGVWALSHFCHS